MKGGGKNIKTQDNLKEVKTLDGRKRTILWNMDLESVSQTVKVRICIKRDYW